MKWHVKVPARLQGPVKAGKRTKILVERLEPGDIALIDHRDLDELAAQSLVAQKVRAVINVNNSISGRYPNKGPQVLWEARIPQFDLAGPDLMLKVQDGERLTIVNGGIWRAQELLATAREVDEAVIKQQTAVAEANLGNLLDAFVQNTLDYARQEKKLILEALEVPPLRTAFAGKHTLVVVRGQSYRQDLEAIKHYIAEVKPVLVGVDGGADALLSLVISRTWLSAIWTVLVIRL